MGHSIRFVKQTSGVYATPDWRFVLEFQRSTRTWRLRERGKLLGYKPGKLRTARAGSPRWLRDDSARGAVAWATQAVNGLVVF